MMSTNMCLYIVIPLPHNKQNINNPLATFLVVYFELQCSCLMIITVFPVFQSFLPMLEKAASLVINLEAGVFVFLMIRTCLNKQNRYSP